MNKIILAALAFSAASPVLAQNLVTNGNFSAGDTGFTTGNTYVAPTANALFPAGGLYTVHNNAADVHNNWKAVTGQGDGGNFLIVNGSTSGNVDAWRSQTITVTANTEYFFEAFATNVCCAASTGAASNLTFIIDGNVSDANLATFSTTNAAVGAWQFLGNTWNSGANTSVNLFLSNASLIANGNDFGVDSINFGTTSIAPGVPEPASWAMLISGFGLIGATARRRRAAIAA